MIPTNEFSPSPSYRWVIVAASSAMLAIGTSLGVFPVANMVPIAVNSGAELVIINAEQTGFDHLASVLVRGSISEVLPGIVGG